MSQFNIVILQKIKDSIPKRVRRYVITPIFVGISLTGIIAALQNIFTWWSIPCIIIYFSLGILGGLDYFAGYIKK